MTSNSTSAVSSLGVSQYLGITFRFLCFAIGAPINTFVFFRLARRATVSTSRSLLLKLQLNISDLMVLIFYAFIENLSKITGTFHGGEVLCRTLKFVNELSFQISSSILVCIGVDRMLSVIQPFTPIDEAKKRVKIMICIAWFYSAGFSADNLFMWRIINKPGISAHTPACVGHLYYLRLTNQNITQPLHDYELARTIISIITVFWLPFFAMVVCYTVIVRAVWKHYANPIIKELTQGSTTDRDTNRTNLFAATKESKAKRWSWSLAKRGNEAVKNEHRRSRSSTKSERSNEHTSQLIEERVVSGDFLEVPNVGYTRNTGKITMNNMASSRRSLPQTVAHTAHHLAAERVLAPTPHSSNSAHVIRVRRVPIRMLKTTVCLMNVYFLCWVPYNASVLWYYIDRASYGKHATVIGLLHLLIVLNSVINPFIYGLYAAEIQPHLRSFDVGICWDTCRFLFGCESCMKEPASSGAGSNQQNAAEKYG